MLKHKYKISAIAICLLFFFLALFSSLGNGILADEIPHISAGYYYLKTHRYFINSEHPPLVKDIAGLGELIVHPTLPNITDQETLPPDYHRPEYPFQNADFPRVLEWQNNQDHFGTMFLYQPQNNPDKIAFFARLAVILANTLLLFLLFVLLAKIWSERAAVLGLFFFAVSPFAIGHGSYVVIDFMSAVLTAVAIVSFAIYLKKFGEEKPTAGYFSLSSLFFALALLSKFSSVVLLPAAFIGGLVYVLFVGVRHLQTCRCRTPLIFKYIFSYAAVVVLAFFLISVFYAFHVWKMEDNVLVQKINENYPEEQLPAVGHKVLEAMVYSNVLTKGLAAYINGVFMVMSRMIVSAQNTYFLGHVYGNEGAGVRYFPVLYFAKLPPGFHFFTLLVLILVIARSVATWQSRAITKNAGLLRFTRNDNNGPLPILLWVFILCYMAITLRSTFQIGLRHIMPVILAAALLTGRGTDLFWETVLKLNFRKFLKFSFRVKHFFALVAIFMILSVFRSFPYYLEYYNPLAGGTDKGYFVATDSNYDWGGSDVRRLAAWMHASGVRDIYTQIFADVPLKFYLGDGQRYFNLQNEGKLPPSGSYLAVSNYEYMNNVYSADVPPERKFTILKDNLVARVGKTIFVYRVP